MADARMPAMPAPISPITLASLEAFPAELARHFAALPVEFAHWTPASWAGVPSEPFTALEQLCHLRDIEIDGYHERFARTLNEDAPLLPSIDSEAVARQRHYGAEDPARVLAEFRDARTKTMALLRSLDESQIERRAVFEGYGPVSLRALVHYLCSHDQQHLAGLQWLLGKAHASRVSP